MAWERRRYRGNKAWVELEEGGGLVLDARGLARLRYKPDDDRTYSVRPSELGPVEASPPRGGGAAPRGERAADPAPAPKAPKRRRAVRPAAAASRPSSRAGDEDGPTAQPTDGAPGDDVPALVGKEIHVWTDGAASGNPGPAGAGYVLLFREHRKEGAIWLGDATNNVAELTAVREALGTLTRHDVPVRIFTDSTYVIGVLTGAMRAKANAALICEIRELLSAFADLRFVKVAAHAGVEWNERADALAREAIRARRTRMTRDATGTP